MNQDKVLICRECEREFAFTESEQAFYMKQGFDHAPRRCAKCRMSERALDIPEKPKRELYEAICSDCGAKTLLPFRPKGDRPVYCELCLQRKKKAAVKSMVLSKE